MNHKRLFTLLLALCLILSVVPMTALADDWIIASGKWNGGPVTWKITADGTLTISGNRYIQEQSSYVWGDYADIVTSIVVEDGITTIPKYCFSDMSNVQSVYIGNAVTSIDKYAFCGCEDLMSVAIPASVETIGLRAFYDCHSLKEITFAENGKLESIGEEAFFGAPITELTTPTSLREIGLNAFSNCTELASLTFLPGVETISASFRNCTKLTTLSFPETVLTISDTAFENCNDFVSVEFYGADTIPLTGQTSLTTVVIGGSIRRIYYDAFTGCTELSSVTITAPLEEIGQSAFEGCIALKEIKLPETLKTIGNWAFRGTGLTSIVLPDSVKNVGMNAFAGCKDLVYADCGSGIEVLHGTFKGCTSLTVVDLGNVAYPGWNTFEGCTALTAIVLPPTTTELGSKTFADCENLKAIYFAGDALIYSPPNNDTFTNVTAKVYYPANNDTWTEDIMQDYRGDITWLPMCEEHNFASVITNPTAAIPGYTTHKCTVCGFFYMDNYVPAGHTYTDDKDTICDDCGWVRHVDAEYPDNPPVVHMFRLYDPNSGEHFYTGSTEERENLVAVGWNYEGVGFSFPVVGAPVYRLYDPVTGEHMYTMDIDEVNYLIGEGWNNEGIAFNTAPETEVPQYRLHNPNETRGAYHFTSSTEERDNLLAVGWEYQGIGWYSCWK